MTKAEAIAAMLRGKKVTHTYFCSGEWMTMKDDFTIAFEDGVQCPVHEFWYDRTDDGWNSGYSLFQGGAA